MYISAINRKNKGTFVENKATVLLQNIKTRRISCRNTWKRLTAITPPRTLPTLSAKSRQSTRSPLLHPWLNILNFLDEVDPTKNNFVILHFMGSHANYLSRYPASATQWGEPGVEDLMLNYYNSLHYTDSVLKEIYNYGREKLNLEAMIYFSDHGCVPNKRRKSYFTGFGTVRIPLSIHFTDSYINHHKERFEAFKANKDKYFTNDLTYEMVCAMFDIESNNFNPSNSIGHSEYKYTKEMLKTDCGAIPLTDEDKL